MNSRKTSLSHVMNDNISNTSDHHYQQQSTSSACSLKNLLSPDDGPSSHVHTQQQQQQQHASPQHSQSPPPPPQQQQQYNNNNHGAGNSGSGGNNNNNLTYGGGASYSNEQQQQQQQHHNNNNNNRDYYHSRSHQSPHSQPPHSQPQPSTHNQQHHHQHQHQHQQQHQQQQQEQNMLEAGSILLSLSNQNTQQQQQSSPHYISSRDHYPSKDNDQQMTDVVEAANTISSISNISNNSNNIKQISQINNQRPRAKSNSMSIASLCDDDSTTSSNSMPSGSSMESSQQKYHHHHHYSEDVRNGDIHSHNINQMQNHQNHQVPDYNNLYSSSNRKHPHMKRPPSNGSIPLAVNTNANPKIPPRDSKMIQKRGSPQKRRPSEPNEFIQKPKLHHSSHFSHGPSTTSSGPKLTDVREQLGEERRPIAPPTIVPIGQGPNHMDWDRPQHTQSYHQARPSHNIPPPQPPQVDRYMNNHPPPIPKNGSSPSLHNDPQKLNYMNHNERQLNKAPSPPNGPPVHAPNGYSHGHGVPGVSGMMGSHTDIPQPSQQPPPPMLPPQQMVPQIRGQNSAFSNQFHKKYYEMKHDPKMKRNAPQAYISYLIYTTENAKSKESHLQSQPSQNNMQNRQIIPNGSPPLNNDHGMVNPPIVPHHQPQVNGNIYGSREPPQHPGYHPIQPNNSGYIHPSEASQGVMPPRRVSDPSMHPHPNVNAISGSRNISHGYSQTHVNGQSIEEQHQPPQPPPSQPHTPHRHSISSHNSSPSLPAHSSAANQHPTQRHVSLPNLLPAVTNQHLSQRHVSLPNVLTPIPPLSTSRSGNMSHQSQTALPPIQSTPSHHHHHNHPSNSHPHHHHLYSQEQQHTSHTHHSHSHYHQPVSQASQPPPPPPPPSVYMSVPPPLVPQHSYSGKSAQSQIPPSQSPITPPSTNHYHHPSPPIPPPQSGSNRHHHHHHHHSQTSSEPVGPPINGNPPQSNNILNLNNPPLTRYLDSQSQQSGYGSNVHSHHHHPPTNGVVTSGHPVHIGGPPPNQVLGPPVGPRYY